VNRAKVMSARSLMSAARNGKCGGTVMPEAKIASFAPDIVAAQLPFSVVDGAGRVLGEVTPSAVIDLLAGRDGSEARP
jgi:glycine betaine/proline transport system ATP-binding protein